METAQSQETLRSGKGIWSFPKTRFQQIPPASRPVIDSKLLTNATFQQKFLDDFGALGNNELLAMMELMAKNNGAAVDNWILMLQNTIEEERKLLAYLESSTLTNSLIRYYDESSLKNILKNLEEPITGNRSLTYVDFANAWLKMGVNPSDGKKILKELELTWHHIDDLDINMQSTLQLVRKEAHAPISHSGSVKQAEVLFNQINTIL